ncbi:MmgE/PrpD family protein [Falsiroseomonas sp. HW251]|uniref:MmgE/PrpD family protein n=1 Tax=Falsiroseomonas sp. HW251 TaxID=3390998 RepID=UPI003D31DA26
MTDASLTEGLAALLARRIAPADRRRATLHLLDWIGCAVAGAASEAGAVFRAQAASQPPGSARVILGPRLTARDAAFANGAFGNVLEMDDVHREAILHPGPVVIPAALALAVERGADAGALLDAILRGYEAEIRIGRAMGGGHYAKFHPTATMGVFGVAAACASLLGLDATRLVWALGNAGTQAGGVWQCRHEPVMTKQLHTARAAAMGLEAAQLAAFGLTGPRLILEGPQGVFAGLASDAKPYRVLDTPDAPWLAHETSFKPWPACRHAHPTIDAALALRDRVAGRAIEAVRVESYADALAFCDRAVPRSTVEAKFSLQHAVAVALLDGKPPLSAFDPPALDRADLSALRARVTVAEDPALTRAYPAHFGAAVAVTLADGTTLREAMPDALGDPENPLDDAAIVAKACMLMGSAGVAPDAIVAAALALAEGGTVAALNAALPGDHRA